MNIKKITFSVLCALFFPLVSMGQYSNDRMNAPSWAADRRPRQGQSPVQTPRLPRQPDGGWEPPPPGWKQPQQQQPTPKSFAPSIRPSYLEFYYPPESFFYTPEELQSMSAEEIKKNNLRLKRLEKLKKIKDNNNLIIYFADTETLKKDQDNKESKLYFLTHHNSLNVLVVNTTLFASKPQSIVGSLCNGEDCPSGFIPVPEIVNKEISSIHATINERVKPGQSLLLLIEKNSRDISQSDISLWSKEQINRWIKKHSISVDPFSGAKPGKSKQKSPSSVSKSEFDRSADPFQPVIIPAPTKISKSKLYTYPHTCLPCRKVEGRLNEIFPNFDWKKYVDYIDAPDFQSPGGGIPCVVDSRGNVFKGEEECFSALKNYIINAKKQEGLQPVERSGAEGAPLADPEDIKKMNEQLQDIQDLEIRKQLRKQIEDILNKQK